MGGPCFSIAAVTALTITVIFGLGVSPYISNTKPNEKEPLSPTAEPCSHTVRAEPNTRAGSRQRASTYTYVYRLLRGDEKPSRGLRPKDPNAKKSIEDHVRIGSRFGFKSQFISTTACKEDALHLANISKVPKNPERIAMINLCVLKGVKIYDLTKPEIRNISLKSDKAKKYAERFNEVIVEGMIPTRAIINVTTLQRTPQGLKIVP